MVAIRSRARPLSYPCFLWVGTWEEMVARFIRKLSTLAVARTKAKGMYADGGGLYLQVSESGTKSWIFRFAARGKTRDMGLGSLHTIGLAEARRSPRSAASCGSRRSTLLSIDKPIEWRPGWMQPKPRPSISVGTRSSPLMKSAGAMTSIGNSGQPASRRMSARTMAYAAAVGCSKRSAGCSRTRVA